jgi:transcription elongation factor Elf1
VAQTAEAVAATPVAKSILIEVITEFLSSHSPVPVPRPLIRQAVVLIVDAVPEIELATVRSVLANLPIPAPASWVSAIWGEFKDRVEDDEDGCEVECPESGDVHLLSEGDGTYTCGDCGADIEVTDGEGVHAIEVECPVADESFWAGPEDGTYDCPLCDLEVTVEDGEAEHDPVPKVRCPISGDTIQLEQGEGTYTCPDCGEDIEVDEDGDAVHARTKASRRRSTRRK